MKIRVTFLMIVGLIVHFALFAQVPTNGLRLSYDFSGTNGTSVPDISGNGYNATLQNGAKVEKAGDFNVLKLGTSNGYLDMGTGTGSMVSTLTDFSVATYLFIDSNSSISGNGFFVWSFSTSSACSKTGGKYIAYRANAQRYAITTAGWGSENGVQVGSAASRGAWHHVVYTQSGSTGTLYIDGSQVATATLSQSPSAIGEATIYNWLGRSPFSGDSYLQGASYYDFRIYDRALSTAEIGTFAPVLSNLNSLINIADVDNAKLSLTLTGIDALRSNLLLPSITGSGVAVTWSSSNTSVLGNNGVVTRPEVGLPNVTLTLTATLSKGNYSTTKSFTVTVLSKLENAAAAQQDADNININTSKCYCLEKIKLPTVGSEGSLIKWESSAPGFLTNLGDVVKLPAKGQGTKTVTLTATVTNGSALVTKDFNICIKEDDGFVGYLWVYFIGNSAYTQENIFFAMSADGYNFKALNAGNYVIKSDTISNMNGVRDPHIMRGPDGKYYMVATDMRASLGWESNHGIVLMKSDDLIHWKHTAIDIKAKYPQFSNITHAWAPETIYDEKTGKYMIYFSMKTSASGSHAIIYYAYANADFTGLESAPQLLFDNGVSTIDGCIVYRDGQYNLFFKTEDAVDKGYKKAVSDRLTGGYVLVDKYLDQSSVAVEGGCVFKLNNQSKYILMYDLYTTGKYEFSESTDLLNFSVVTAGVSRDFAPRHGTVMGITAEEATRLAEKWGNSSMVGFGTSEAPESKPNNIEVDETAKTVFIPVKQGTDLTSFDPRIQATVPGVAVTPQGAQDFSHGAVSYALSLNGTTNTYNVTSAVNNNPVITGYYADPEILYSVKTGRFYIYPTTDGFPDWGGYSFKVFSSVDLVNWTDEGAIINMHDANQIGWANGNAWAPCIIEKKINGEYKYVFYFSGGLNGGAKQLGYAISDSPTGPFVVSGSPLITSSPTGSGQQIDSDVFTDPVSSKTYLYWGNGYMAVAELNDDLTSLKTTPKVITPSSNYTEGTYVFYRNGKYYFTWSNGNTNNADYRVYYGYSASPTGPITIPSNNNTLVKDLVKGINGPGHNSIIQIPGKDEWYIVYHRISRPNGITNTSPGPGNVREICIDKLLFNSDGTIKTVVPTLEGISPVDLSQSPSALEPVTYTQDKGAIKSMELYSIAGVKMDIRKSMNKGVYLLKKTYVCGQVEFVKMLLNGDKMENKFRDTYVNRY